MSKLILKKEKSVLSPYIRNKQKKNNLGSLAIPVL